MDRKFYFELGEYDPELLYYGAEYASLDLGLVVDYACKCFSAFFLKKISALCLFFINIYVGRVVRSARRACSYRMLIGC